MKIMKVSFALILSIIAYEFFLKFSPFSFGLSPVAYDQDVGMWHKLNFSSYHVSECGRTKYFFDDVGRVKNKFSYDKQKKDLVLIGDSQVEALMVKNGNIMHNILGERVNNKFNILNYGLSGTGPSQQLSILSSKVDLDNAYAVIQFVSIENDLNDSDPYLLSGTLHRPKVYYSFSTLDDYLIIPPSQLGKSEMVREFVANFEWYPYLKKTYYHYKHLLVRAFFYKQEVEKTHDAGGNDSDVGNKNQWMNLMGAIYQTNKVLSGNGVEYYLMLYSEKENKDNDKFNINKLGEFLDNNQIKYGSVNKVLSGYEVVEIYNQCDGHWNEVAHAAIAEWIYLHVIR